MKLIQFDQKKTRKLEFELFLLCVISQNSKHVSNVLSIVEAISTRKQ